MLYFDTSFLVPYFTPEDASAGVEAFFRRQRSADLAISHWTHTEFTSAIGLKVRMKLLSQEDATAVLAAFQEITTDYFHTLTPQPTDFMLAAEFLQHWELRLRAGDALHLAIAVNHEAKKFYTFDKRQADAAKVIKVPVKFGA
jgi:uncharacterized protein